MELNALDVDMNITVHNPPIIIELVIKNNNPVAFKVDKNQVGLLVGSYNAYLTINHIDANGNKILDEYGSAELSSRIATGYRGPWREDQVAEIPANGEIKSSFDISKYYVFLLGCNRYSIEFSSYFDVPLVLNVGKFDELPPGWQMLHSKTKPIYFEYCKDK